VCHKSTQSNSQRGKKKIHFSYLLAWEIQPGISRHSIHRIHEAGWEKGGPREYNHIHMDVHEDKRDLEIEEELDQHW
jgi:hypothetical protein